MKDDILLNTETKPTQTKNLDLLLQYQVIQKLAKNWKTECV